VDATVSTRGAVSRFAWDDVLDGRRWLTTSGEELAGITDALADDGAVRVALVTADPVVDLAAVEGWQPGEPVEVRPGTAVVLLTR
jgi:hypothetical protein